jgi:hypothetical protein
MRGEIGRLLLGADDMARPGGSWYGSVSGPRTRVWACTSLTRATESLLNDTCSNVFLLKVTNAHLRKLIVDDCGHSRPAHVPVGRAAAFVAQALGAALIALSREPRPAA